MDGLFVDPGSEGERNQKRKEGDLRAAFKIAQSLNTITDNTVKARENMKRRADLGEVSPCQPTGKSQNQEKRKASAATRKHDGYEDWEQGEEDPSFSSLVLFLPSIEAQKKALSFLHAIDTHPEVDVDKEGNIFLQGVKQGHLILVLHVLFAEGKGLPDKKLLRAKFASMLPTMPPPPLKGPANASRKRKLAEGPKKIPSKEKKEKTKAVFPLNPELLKYFPPKQL